LVKSVIQQVVADWLSHVTGRPWSSASTDLQLGIHLYRLLESVTMKPTCERLHGGAGWPGVWPASHPLGPLVSSLYTLPPRVRYSPRVTLILVEF
jgi:hypothetical protein